MSDLKHGYPQFHIGIQEPKTGLARLIEILTEFSKRIVIAVNSKQDKDEELNIKYYSQDAEPTLAANENAAFWEDTDGGPAWYLVLKEAGGAQKKVELT